MALPSFTIVITAEESAAADASNTKKRRKRRMAGHQVAQIVQAGRILPPHRQQPEHLTAPPIKLKRVSDDQLRIASSPEEQTTPEPMEAEPALPLSSNSLPVAVIRPMPQSSPINQANVIIENAQIEPGVSEMATSSRQNPVIQPATVSYRETMEHFDPEHYDQLIDKFDNQEYPLEILEAATQVLETCQNRAIKVKATLFSMLKFHVISRHHNDLKKFYEKSNVFFGAMNLEVARDTACLTSMLNKSNSSNIATISNSFINMGDTKIQYIAKSPWLKNISSICNGKGLPKDSDVKGFLKLPCLKEGWQSNDEAVQDRPFDRELVTNISSMCHGKGIPKEADVKAFLKLACLKEGWQGNDESVQDKRLDRALVTHISSMCSSKGLPKEVDVKAFLKLPCLKEGWQGNDESVQDKPVNRALVTNMSSMCHGKGLPKEADVKAFLKLACLKEDWQGNDEAVKDKPLDRALVTHISSMCNGKGLPKEADVKAFLKQPCLKESWQGNDEAVQNKPLDRALVTNISSMSHGKGLPKEANVKAFLKLPCLKEGWQGNNEAVQDKPLDRALVTHISSMFNGKGLPKEADVKAFLKQPCLKEGWQSNDEAVQNKPLDRALVTSISSMCHGRGLPKEVNMKAFLKLPCLKEGWQGNDEAVQDKPLDRALVTHISSMCNGKGLPKEAEVKGFLKLPCLKKGWQGKDEAVQDKPLDRALIIRISSMCSSKGLPKEAKVKAFLKLPCLKEGWQGNDEAVQDQPFDWALVTHISSMCCSKGLPKEADVKTFLKLPCLKEGWQGNDEAVQDQPFDWALVTHISSMCCSKGLPKEADVKTFLKLPCLKEGWQGNDEAVQDKPLDRPLVTNMSSMCNGKGLPKEADVKAFLKLACLKEGWQGNDAAVQDKPFDRALVTNISSMRHGKGLPKEANLKAFVQWLPSDAKKHFLKLACRIFAGSGLPKQETLAIHEKILCHYFKEKLTNTGDVGSIAANSRECLLAPESREHIGGSRCPPCTESRYSMDNGYDSSDTNNDLPEAFQIKALTLFCVAPAKWRMAIAEFDQYLTAHKMARGDRTAVLSALESLLLILANHGGPGVRFWLEKHHENLHGKEKLTKALSIPAPLEQTKFALTQLPESQWQEYIELCKNLKPAPNKAQWDALKPLRQQLDQWFKLTLGKRMMLEILWPQSQENRSGYAGQIDSLFKAVPTISQLHRIHRAYEPQKMKDFLDACLAWQGTREKVPKVRIQERLLEGLLLANHHLDGQGDIPDLCFSKRVSSDSGKGVIVDGDRAMAGQERLWHFIDAMLIELGQTRYEFRKQRLTVLLPDGEPVVLPKPEFALTGTGFVIKNWSSGQLTAFFLATEFTEQWYEKPHDKPQPCMIRLEEKIDRMKAGSKENAHNKDKNTTPLLLAPSNLLNLINSKRPLKPAVWKSIEHYAKNGQLTARLCKALATVIDNEPKGIVPDVVKNTVTASLPQIQGAKAPEVKINTLTSALQRPMSVGIQQATFETAMKALDRFQVLEKAELEMLESHRNRMTFIQLMSVITKISDSVDAQTQIQWYIAYEQRRKDLLGLNEIWAQDWLSASESRSQDWIEELLR